MSNVKEVKKESAQIKCFECDHMFDIHYDDIDVHRVTCVWNTFNYYTDCPECGESIPLINRNEVSSEMESKAFDHALAGSDLLG